MRTVQESFGIVVRPFEFSELEIMPKAMSKDGSKAKPLLYFNARSVMNRLDEAFGPENWRAEYREVHMGQNSGFICRLTCKCSDGELVREDGADPTDIEGFKGGISDALKRTFAALGNRCLYTVDLPYMPIETYSGNDGKPKFSKWSGKALADMRDMYERQVLKRVEPQKIVAAQELDDAPTNGQKRPEPKRSAFGYEPERWPTPKMFGEPITDNQVKMLGMKAKERGVAEDDLPFVRTVVLGAFGVGEANTKGNASLFVDWLMNAPEDAMKAAIEAAAEIEPADALGQEAMNV